MGEAVREAKTDLASRTGLRASYTDPALSAPASLPDPAPYVEKTRRWALLAIVLASLAGAAAVAAPLWIALVFGIVMAISAHRPYVLLKRRLGDRASLAAALTTLGCGLLVTVAGAFVLIALTSELLKLVGHLNEHGSSGTLQGLVGPRVARAIGSTGVDTDRAFAWMQKEIESAATAVATTAALVIRTTSQAVLGLVVGLMTMYYLLVEGKALVLRIERIAPLEPRHTRALMVEARDVGRTAFLGTLVTAVVQGVLAGIGYTLLGVPEPVTWALVTGLASFLPIIGTLIVWLPVAGWLVVDGHPMRALVMVGYGVVVITALADYVIRPRIVGRRGHGHPLLTLIALLGGIEVFGLAGLIIAPIIMSVFVAAFRLYEREIRAGAVPGTTKTQP